MEKVKKDSEMIIWLTGQPGSGKTTLAKRFIGDKLIDFMKHHWMDIIHIDGDDMRELTGNKDYTEQGRRKNIKFVMEMAKFLNDQHFIVVVSMVSPYRDQREELKKERNVVELYLHTTEVRGKEKYFVDNYESPVDNFIDIDTDKPIEECVNEILSIYRKMAAIS